MAVDLHLPYLEHATDQESGTVTFIGTATVLVQCGNLTFLTDPNFLHAGDHAHLGYGLRSRRLTNPALEMSDLPPLDFVLLSHHHGDHFDHIVERDLDRALPIITEPESAQKLRSAGFRSVYALQRWESMTVRRGLEWLKVTAMPARHAPGALATLLPSVMGSMLRFGQGDSDPRFHMYITGDTLLVDELTEIGQRYADIDLCMLHLGGTRIAGITLTMDGRQGVRLLELLQPTTAIPIHYDDYTVFKSPLSDFLESAKRSEVATRVVTLERGDTYRFDLAEDNSDEAPFVKLFNTYVERDGKQWAVCMHSDGHRRVVSHHATAQLARRAERELNESANRAPRQ